MALPELYQQQEFQRQTFDKDAEFKRLYGVNASRRDARKFNRYWNSDQRVNDEKAFNATQDAAELAHIQSEQKKYFDSMDARIAAAREQNATRGAATLNNINTSLAAIPAIPTPKPASDPVAKTLTPRSEAEWNRIASEATNGQLKTMADVEAWQRANGFSEDQIDGKFGNYSKEYFKNHNLGKYQINQPIPTAPVLPSASTPSTQVETPKFSLDAFASTNNLTDFRNFNGKRVVRYDPLGRGDWFIDEEGKTYWANGIGTLGDHVESDYKKYIPEIQRRFDTLQGMITASYKKQGGTMNRINYFQQGGAAPQQQDVKAQVTALVQAAMQGDQKAAQQVNQIMEAAKAGDQQAIQIAQLMEQVVKELQGQAVAAKYGAKLDYLQSLKCGGKAKTKKKEQGGKVCPACQGNSSVVSKHQSGGAMNFYRDWSEGDIRKLQMFLSREDMLGDAAYDGDYDGKMGPKTIAAIKAYQKKQGVAADGMWGTNTNKHHKVITSGIVSKSPYKNTHKYEAGNFTAYPTDFTYATMKDFSPAQIQQAVNYYSVNPELLYSDDMEHSKWRQVFHNSGKDGADFLNQIAGSLTPEERKRIDPKKLTTQYKTDALVSTINEGRNEAARQLLPALVAPVALGGLATVATGGAGLAGVTGLLGSVGGAEAGRKIGKKVGRKRGEDRKDETYVDPVAERYGVASSVHDPNRRIAEGEQVGEIVGNLVGGVAGGAVGSLAGAGVQANVYNVMGQGRANMGYRGVPQTAQPSVAPYGTTTPPQVNGVSNAQLFKAGLGPANHAPGQTRLGGTYGTRFNFNGKTYNAGTPASPEVIEAASTYYNNPASPIKINFGGNMGTNPGVKLGRAYDINVPGALGVGAMVTPASLIAGDAVRDTQPSHPARKQKRSDKKEERKEKRQDRHKKLIERTAESTTD